MLSPYLTLTLQGVYLHLSSLDQNWVNVQGGMSQILLAPAGDKAELKTFLLAGCEGEGFIKGMLSSSLSVCLLIHHWSIGLLV